MSAMNDEHLDGIWSRASIGIPVDATWTKRLVTEVRELRAEREQLVGAVDRLAALVVNLNSRVEYLEKRLRVRKVSTEGVEHLFEAKGGPK